MRNGFFTIDEFVEKTKAIKTFPDCKSCRLNRGVNTPKMKVSGFGRRKILVIGEAPGFQEDVQGVQFVGKAGTRLRLDMAKAGIELRNDCWLLNAVNCYPDGKTPTRSQIKSCRPYVQAEINRLKPEFILLVGGKAVESFHMDRFARLGITRWRGFCIPDRETGAWVYSILHPSYVDRKHSPNYDEVFLSDLKFFFHCLKKKPYKHENLDEHITLILHYHDVVTVLSNLLKRPPKHLFFDYETTGLKPHRPGHKILCISFDAGVHAYSFPFNHSDIWTRKEYEHIKDLWCQILVHPDIRLWGQNIKYEDMWSRVLLNTQPTNWHWDTMVASHILDNRSGITSLNFQAYMNFGINPYDLEIKPYIAGSGQFNQLEKAPLNSLLRYSALDSFVGRKLANKQRSRIGKLRPAYNFFHQGILALADMQMHGIHVDLDYYSDIEQKLKYESNHLETSLLKGKEAKAFEEKYKKPLKLTSNPDLGNLFNNVLNISTEISEKDNYIVDKKTLEKIDTKFTRKLLKRKKLDKVGTYLAQFLREGHDGIMYPFFDLHIPASMRSSSSRPNFQNIPVRDIESKKICRSGILPSPGNQLLEVDYGSIEVCISACHHKDPNMIKYITDPDTDMHRDAAKDIWGLEQITDDIRFYAKNCWVFPQFYGSYYAECAKDLWTNCINLPLEKVHPDNPELEVLGKKLLESSGTKVVTLKNHIKTELKLSFFTDFEQHLKDVERKFWGRFKVYAQWKKDINKFYQKNGYITNYFGFKFKGLMDERQVTNYPIQSDAFHCLLWSLIKINDLAKKEKWKTKIIGQIHDSIVFDLYPPERDYVISAVDQITTKDIKKEFPWIIVPLTIDKEITPVNGSWYEKKKYDQTCRIDKKHEKIFLK